MTRSGGVVWVTGLPGVGKTTVARAVGERLRSGGVLPVLLDGDSLRAMVPGDAGYATAERRELALFYARLARELAVQGHLVVCATVSLFHDVREWNRAHLENYLEVWLRAPVDTLRHRGDRVELYGTGADQARSFVGDHLAAEFPTSPDLVIDNFGDTRVDQAVDVVVAACGPWCDYVSGGSQEVTTSREVL